MLIKCIECGREISDRAAACPNCGCPVSETLNKLPVPEAHPPLNENVVFNQSIPPQDDNTAYADIPYPNQNPKTKFYKKTWFIILMLLFVFPVGVFLMWKNKKFHVLVRILFSIVLGINFLFWTLIFVALVIPCDHEWEPATCTQPKTCWICGETEGWALAHDWESATYTKPKTCSVCGLTSGDPLERKEAYNSNQAIAAIKECFDFIPDCRLSLGSKNTDGITTYSLYYDGKLAGIIGLDTDEWDVISLVDTDKTNASKCHEEISIALLMSSDSDMTYEEAKEHFEEAEKDGLIFVYGATYVSEGMQGDMYAFGIHY